MCNFQTNKDTAEVMSLPELTESCNEKPDLLVLIGMVLSKIFQRIF